MAIGFIGCGKMGEAILASLLREKVASAAEVFVAELDEDRREALKIRYGVCVSSSLAPVLDEADVIFLAVKPQVLDAVLDNIAGRAHAGRLFISIAAGKKISGIEALLPASKVVRVMPNLATLVSRGMNVFCVGSSVLPEDRATVERLLACFGKVRELPEAQFDIVTALSGSGPAFFAYYLKAMIDAAANAGLSPEDAAQLGVQTMAGTAALLSQGRLDPDSLIAAVSSAKGTTVAGMAVLEGSTLRETVARTLSAAARRSRELSSHSLRAPTD